MMGDLSVSDLDDPPFRPLGATHCPISSREAPRSQNFVGRDPQRPCQ